MSVHKNGHEQSIWKVQLCAKYARLHTPQRMFQHYKCSLLQWRFQLESFCLSRDGARHALMARSMGASTSSRSKRWLYKCSMREMMIQKRRRDRSYDGITQEKISYPLGFTIRIWNQSVYFRTFCKAEERQRHNSYLESHSSISILFYTGINVLRKPWN